MKLKKGALAQITKKVRRIIGDSACDSDVHELIEEVAENIEHKPAYDENRLRELAGDNHDEIMELIGARAAEDEDEGPDARRDRRDLEYRDRDDRDAKRDDRRERADDEDRGPKATEERRRLEETDRDDRDAKRDDEKERKAAMDAMQREIESRLIAKQVASDSVETLVGRVDMGKFSDAASIYSFALTKRGVAHDGVNEAGLRALVEREVKDATTKAHRSTASDSFSGQKCEFTDRIKKV